MHMNFSLPYLSVPCLSPGLSLSHPCSTADLVGVLVFVKNKQDFDLHLSIKPTREKIATMTRAMKIVNSNNFVEVL